MKHSELIQRVIALLSRSPLPPLYKEVIGNGVVKCSESDLSCIEKELCSILNAQARYADASADWLAVCHNIAQRLDARLKREAQTIEQELEQELIEFLK